MLLEEEESRDLWDVLREMYENGTVERENMIEQRGTLLPAEPHPMATEAVRVVWRVGLAGLQEHLEVLSSCAIEGNRLAEVCAETLRRVLNSEPVSDRYIMGLALHISSVVSKKDQGRIDK